jgi:hypothetical protein
MRSIPNGKAEARFRRSRGEEDMRSTPPRARKALLPQGLFPVKIL